MSVVADDVNERAVIGGNKPPLSEVLAEANKALLAEVEPIADRANKLAAQVKDGIADDTVLGTVGELVTDAKALFRRIETQRVADKEPHLTASREVDAFFATFKDRLTRIDTVFTEAASAYHREKAKREANEAAERAAALRAEEEKLLAAAETAKRPQTVDRKLDQAADKGAQADAAEAAASTAMQNFSKVKTDSGVTAGAKADWTHEITDYEAIPLDKLRPYFKRDQVDAAIKAYVKIHKGQASLAGVHIKQDVKAQFRR